jgi:ankyrin repeat protein
MKLPQVRSYRLSRFASLRSSLATVVVILCALSWNSVAFCDEIHDAATSGDLAKVQALLKDNPQLVFSKDDQTGWTPLHSAAAGGHKDIAELLLANKADVNAKSNDGVTPLHLAAAKGYADIVALLLDKGADVSAKAKGGTTALHMAAGLGQKSVVELLLVRGADPNLQDEAGRTPLSWAEHFGQNDVAEILRKSGGQNTAVDANVTEAQRWAYAMDFGGGQAMYLTPSAIQITSHGDWEAAGSGGGITLDFGASFAGKRYKFNGDMKEFVCSVSLRDDKPDGRTRIITAASIDYDPDAPQASSVLSKAGIVAINPSGFVEGQTTKSGWMNMPATLTLEDGGKRSYIRLTDVSFWVSAGGQDWLSFSVGHATTSDSQETPGTDLPVQAFIVQDGGKSPQGESYGAAMLQIGAHRLRLSLPKLTSKLAFVEDDPTAATGATHE